MSYMFDNCQSLEFLNLSNFQTKKVNNMTRSFFGCFSLIKLEIPKFYIRRKTNTTLLFSNCNKRLEKNITKKNKYIKHIHFEP